jgi:hypothetical protein
MKIFEDRDPNVITTEFFDSLIDLVSITNFNDDIMKKIKYKISHNKTQKLRKN